MAYLCRCIIIKLIMDVKTVIKAHGYTIERVATEWKKDGALSPITKGALSKSINNNPTVATLQGIADVIGCKIGDFFADETSASNAISCPHCGKPIKFEKGE